MTVEHLKRLTLPDEHGRFGAYGGMFVPEILTTPLRELEAARADAFADKSFISEFEDMLRDYVGRPTPLFRARNFEKKFGGKAQVYVKREDLTHTGAHKINNALGQALLALRLGKKRIIAETGAGQHGVAAASVCALLGLECVVYMGEVDMHRQMPNVQRMKALGAKVRSVVSGGAHTERRGKRSDKRLGCERGNQPLPDGERGRATPLSPNGTRLSVHYRAGST